MTKQKQTEKEEMLERNTPPQEQNTDLAPETEEENIQVIGVNDVTPITPEELYANALIIFKTGLMDSVSNQERADVWYKRHFGENYTDKDVGSGLDNAHQVDVVSEYLADRLHHLIKSSTNLDYSKINKNITEMFKLVGLSINISESATDACDEIFKKRAGNIIALDEAYKVLKINRQIAEIHHQQKPVTNINHLVTKMEKVFDEMKVNGNSGLADNEIMAKFYYNVSTVYDSVPNRKNTMTDIVNWAHHSVDYKQKALELTHDVDIVADIQTYWRTYGNYKPEKITDACERIIDTASDKGTLYRANKLYADTKANMIKVDVFSGRQERYADAIEHYRAAMQYTRDDEVKKSLLKDISKLQKGTVDYARTRLELSNLMQGRERIRERLKIADIISDKELKAAVLKSCINEFTELRNIDKRDRNTYNTIDMKLRKVVPADDTKTLDKLDTLKKKGEAYAFRLQFTMEDEKQCKKILSFYKNADNGNLEEADFLYTTGHSKRGVE